MKNGFPSSCPASMTEQGLPQVAGDLPSFVDQVIVVDNNSTDHLPLSASRSAGRSFPKHGAAMDAPYKTGLAAATGDIIVTMDGDGTYPRNFFSHFPRPDG